MKVSFAVQPAAWAAGRRLARVSLKEQHSWLPRGWGGAPGLPGGSLEKSWWALSLATWLEGEGAVSGGEAGGFRRDQGSQSRLAWH